MKLSFFIIISLISFSMYSQSEIISEDILIKNDNIELPGTLTYTKNKLQSLIIFVPGSGNPNRDGNQPQLGVNGSYIKQLSNALNEKGFAFYRYDKRNATPNNLKYTIKSFQFEDLVNDVKSVLDKFKDDKRFNSIILIGHSQGSLVAMLAVNEYVDKYISLAGLGESADQTIIRQITSQSADFGEIAKSHINELKQTGTIENINPSLISIFAKSNHKFLNSYFKYDPKREIKKLNLPILIINGDKDLQVKKADANNLHEANPKSKLVIIENMNHVLKIITKEEDNLKSYSLPDFPLSEKLILEITNFINE